MRKALLPAALLFAACASSTDPERPEVGVTAADDAEGVRVMFQLNKGDVTAHEVKVEVESGEVRDFCRSHDLRRVSVLWTNDEGIIECTFPYGQSGEWESGGERLSDDFRFVFHESERGRVSARVPRGAPMRPTLLLHVEVPAKELPATLQWEGREARELVRESSMISVAMPMGPNHVLETGDWKVTLKTKNGSADFLIGLDPDGTPTATNGYVRRSR